MSPKIHSSFWTDDDVWELTPENKLALLWIITNGKVDNAGCLELSPRQFSIETRLEASALDGAIKGLPRAFVKCGRTLWIRHYMRHQWTAGERSHTSRLHKSIVNAIAAMPIELRVQAVAEYPEFEGSYKALASPLKALQTGEGPCKGLEGPRAEQSRAEQSRVLSSSGGVGGEPPTMVEWEIVQAWHQRMLSQGSDYTEAEVRSAWLHFQSTRDAETGQWSDGRKAITDWRVALESRVQRVRQWADEKKTPGTNGAHGAVSASVAAVGEQRVLRALKDELFEVGKWLDAVAGQVPDEETLEKERREKVLRREIESLTNP